MAAGNELLTGADFRRMIAGAYARFLVQREYIDSLNVFPVPDGDTGTNMLLTLGTVNQALASTETEGIGQLSRRAADSAIMGARGNSGVILAQLFRGIARGLAGKTAASSSELGKAFQYGILYAYRAVAKPVEGTILTVAKGIARGARRAVRDKLAVTDLLREAIKAGRLELAQTPELLPALKEAGVVDAGGQGLIVLLEGCVEGLEGRYTSPEANLGEFVSFTGNAGQTAALVHPYCTEFLVGKPAVSAKEAKKQLAEMGDSLVIAEAGEALKVHIHTARPGRVLETGMAWGSLHNIKIDNMADQYRENAALSGKRAGIGVIAVSPGPGLSEIMRNMGASVIVEGGQTMNPPVEAFVDAVHRGEAERYIILPNNANIVLAAAQARKLLGDKVEVVETRNIPQGLAALLAFDPNADLAANAAAMKKRAGEIRAAVVTTAVRDTTLGGRRIKAGQYIGVADNKTATAGDELAPVLEATVRQLTEHGGELITLYYGDALDGAEAARLAEGVGAAFPDLQLEVYEGGQPLYCFIIGVE